MILKFKIFLKINVIYDIMFIENKKRWIKMILENVHEYGERDPVELKYNRHISNKLCVVTYNEAGHNSTWIDAEELYKALKNYFESEDKVSGIYI